MNALDPLVPTYLERLAAYLPGPPVEPRERELGSTGAVMLASNENPLGPSPRALAAAAAALAESHRYPDQWRLRAALALHHHIDATEVMLGAGINELLDLIALTFGSPGCHAVYADPSFVWYRIATTALNMVQSEVPLREYLSYDVDALVAALRPDTRLLFLANPNNPTGAYLGEQALGRLLEAVPEQTTVVLDEAYGELADAHDFVSAMALRRLHPRLIVLRTFSKAYGLAGLRVGYGVAPAAIVAAVDRVRAPFNVSRVALAAAEASLTDSAHLERYIAHNAHERARVTAALANIEVRVAPSQANFLLVRFPSRLERPAERLLQMGVIVRTMPVPIADWVRVSLGTQAENDRLLAAVHALLAPRQDHTQP